MMSVVSRQAELFDTGPPADCAAQELGRARMRATIDRLAAASEPPWTNEMGVILEDGAFKRAMWLVPRDEGQALWAVYDAQMERLYAIWAASEGREAHGGEAGSSLVG